MLNTPLVRMSDFSRHSRFLSIFFTNIHRYIMKPFINMKKKFRWGTGKMEYAVYTLNNKLIKLISVPKPYSILRFTKCMIGPYIWSINTYNENFVDSTLGPNLSRRRKVSALCIWLFYHFFQKGMFNNWMLSFPSFVLRAGMLLLLPWSAFFEVEEAEAVDDTDHGVIQPLLQLTDQQNTSEF